MDLIEKAFRGGHDAGGIRGREEGLYVTQKMEDEDWEE